MLYGLRFYIMKVVIYVLFIKTILGDTLKPTIETPLGLIEGHVKYTVQNRTIYAFEGIPYAQPPIGHNRFREPLPPKPWVGIWKAQTTFACMQKYPFVTGWRQIAGDEDCLYLNVYSPNLNPQAKLNVLVFIHGGAFMYGLGGVYGSEIVLDRNIVYVSINYRLGPLGFLSTEDDEVPGNNGLRDQIMALRWIKENIGLFGGNSDSVTISGMSCGGASVHFHYLLPNSKGLFQRGISQSGVSINSWVLMENALERTKELADIVGCPTINTTQIINCLRSKPARQIVIAVNKFQPFLGNPFSPFGVVVDGWWATDPLLPDHPYKLLSEKKVLDLPWITSYVSSEGLYPAADFYDGYLAEIDARWKEILPHILHFNFTIDPDSMDNVSSMIRSHYFGNQTVNKNTFSKLVDALGDRLFIADIEIGSRLHSEAVKSPVYSYVFDYVGNIFFFPSLQKIREERKEIVAWGETLQKPLVHTPLGPIEGHLKQTVNNNSFYAFEGVPYARPPIGEYRFKEPVSPGPWKGVLKAKTIFQCLQYDHYNEGQHKIAGDEDCLYVNIYTRKVDQEANLDVLVYIHGGAFMFNYGAVYGPELILDRNVVFVNLNYRLGPLGFLSTEDEVVPGNNGLRDQIQALKWIKENIKYFGGNSESITLLGMSAGGASVHFHYLLPQSNGLFNRGISQSGLTLNSWVLMENPLERTKEVADLVGCPTDDTRETVECLRTKPARQIVGTVKQFQPFLYNPFSPFGAVVDGEWSSQPLLPDHPYKLLKEGRVQDIPWIISYVAQEGLYPAADFYFDDILSDIDDRWNEIIPHVLHYNYTIHPKLRDRVSEKIRKHYLGNDAVNKKSYPKLVELIGDRLFIVDIEKGARLHSAAVQSPVYGSKFEYRGAHSSSEFRSRTDENIGVSHADDTQYILKTRMDTLSTENDKKMTTIMIDLVTSFMRDGKPTVGVDWKPLSKKTSDPWRQLNIKGPRDIKMEEKTILGQREFWDSLPFQENEKLLNIKDEL